MADPRDHYTGILWDNVREADYPSPTMLDRLERSLRTIDDGDAYLELLAEKASNMYPSHQLLDRMERVGDAVALAIAMQEQLGESSWAAA